MKVEIKKTKFSHLLAKLVSGDSEALSIKLFGNHCCWSEIININGPVYSQTLSMDQDLWLNQDADTLIVFGSLNPLAIEQIKIEYENLLPPKRVIAFGQCAINGGPFQNYSQINLSDHIKIDMIVPGCPPTPENLLQTLKLQGENND